MWNRAPGARAPAGRRGSDELHGDSGRPGRSDGRSSGCGDGGRRGAESGGQGGRKERKRAEKAHADSRRPPTRYYHAFRARFQQLALPILASWVVQSICQLGRPLFAPGAGLGAQDYRPQFEVLLYGHTGKRSRRTWNAGRRESDVWDFTAGLEAGVVARELPRGGMAIEVGGAHETVQVLLPRRSSGKVVHFDGRTSDVWRFARERGTYRHPTQKPVALVERALRNSSREGDLVLDLFAGSGSTLIAAEQLDRRAALMELDPLYCDVIVERWEAFTGRKAQKARK